MQDRLTDLHLTLLRELEQRPLSSTQLAEWTGLYIITVRARLSELRNAGLIEDSGQRFINPQNRTEIIFRLRKKEEVAVSEQIGLPL